MKKENQIRLGRPNFISYLQKYSTGQVRAIRRKNLVLSLLRPRAQEIILDEGCGVGAYSHDIAKSGAFVVSVDLSKEALKISKTVYAISSPICCDVTFMPFKESSFDKAIAIDVIEHILDTKKFLSELTRCLKIEGVTIIATSPVASNMMLPLVKKIKTNRFFCWLLRIPGMSEEMPLRNIQHPRSLKANMRFFGFEIVMEKYWNVFHTYAIMNRYLKSKVITSFLTNLDKYVIPVSPLVCNDMIIKAKKHTRSRP